MPVTSNGAMHQWHCVSLHRSHRGPYLQLTLAYNVLNILPICLCGQSTLQSIYWLCTYSVRSSPHLYACLHWHPPSPVALLMIVSTSVRLLVRLERCIAAFTGFVTCSTAHLCLYNSEHAECAFTLHARCVRLLARTRGPAHALG